jgi:hypothetical protein
MTTVASAIKTKYQPLLTKQTVEEDVFSPFASKTKMEKGAGKTVRWQRVRRLAKVTSFNLSDGDLTGTPKAFTTDYDEAEVGVFGDYVEITKGVDLTSILTKGDQMNEVKDQIVRSKLYLGLKQISQHCLRHRVDNDPLQEVNGTADTSTTIALVDDALTQDIHHWGQTGGKYGFVCGTSPENVNYDFDSLVTAFTATSDTCEVAFKQACTGMKYHLVRGTNLAATDLLTSTAISRVAGYHQLLHTEPYKGGIYHGFIHPAQLRNLYADTVFVDIMKYSQPSYFKTYQTFQVFGIDFIVTNELYREDVDGSENQSTGIVYVSPIFGRNAFNITKWTNGADGYGVEINVINKPDTGNVWGLKHWISWHGYAALATQRATSVIGLMTGATDMGIIV